MASNSTSDTNVTWFIYRGPDGEAVPRDVTHLRVHPSVTVIPAAAFHGRVKLQQVELPDGLRNIGEGAFYECHTLRNVKLPEGLQEIGEWAFGYCHKLSRMKIPSAVVVIFRSTFYDCSELKRVELSEGLREIRVTAFEGCYSLERINFPSTIKNIGYGAFCGAELSSIDLPDGLEDIGERAFYSCRELNSMRIPPLITGSIPRQAFDNCHSLFSLELSQGTNVICDGAFSECYNLRNLAFPTDVEIGRGVFCDCKDLLRLFGTTTQIEDAMFLRFDGLPIHKLLYYQSYYPTEKMLTRLGAAMTSSAQSGNQQDCLGMTPLHILTCSKKPNIELYKMPTKVYPENLVTEDKWGCLPIFYAFWGGASGEIIQFLVDSHKTNFPHHVLNWGKMVESLSEVSVPSQVLTNLLDTQKSHFPDQQIDLDNLLNYFARPSTSSRRRPSAIFKCLIRCSISARVESIGLKQLRKDIADMIEGIPHFTDHDNLLSTNTRRAHLDRILSMLAAYERDFQSLKEATTTLELALWRVKMNEDMGLRNQCRISCGADIVIGHVLPYLLPDEKGNDSVDNDRMDESSGGEEDIDEEGDSSDDDGGMEEDY